MSKGCSANDTLIGPDLPWVEFVETELYVSAYKKVTVSSIPELVNRRTVTFLRSGIKCSEPHPLFPYTFSQSS
jgi:hypothetical protein